MMNKKQVAAMVGISNLYYIDKKDVVIDELTDLNALPLKEVGPVTPITFDDIEQSPQKTIEGLSLSFEAKADKKTVARWREMEWEWLCKTVPWIKRNFVKETITHKIEY